MRDAVFVMLLFVNAAFVCLGGLIFHLLEYYNEAWAHESLKLEFLKFLGNHSCVHPKILLDFTHRVVHHSQRGINLEEIELFYNISLNWVKLELVTSSRIWDYSSAFLFCVTVITTIGYGRLAPTTWAGRLFCIFYTLTGIPLFASMMAGLGERLQELLISAQRCGQCIKGHPVLDARLKSITILVLSAAAIVMVPSFMFCFFLRWSFLDAVYYSVITLTTVGFGDLFPAEDKSQLTFLYRFLLSVWIFVGLGWVALVLTEVGTSIQRRIERAAVKSAELSSIVSKRILKSPVSLRSQTASPYKFQDELSVSV